jgi:hypothetical protein
MKKFTFTALLSIFLLSAGTLFAQDGIKAKQPAAVTQDQAEIVTPETFQAYAANNIGKEVEITGMVIHVCRHGGKQMFIIGEDPDKRVKISASEAISVFMPELEGSTIAVKGIIEPIEEEELPESEKANQDADHTNYYHVPQYAISCLTLRTLEE